MLNHLQLVMPRRHTMQERVFIVKNYYQTGNYCEVVRRFEDTYGRSIDRKSIPSIIRIHRENRRRRTW